MQPLWRTKMCKMKDGFLLIWSLMSLMVVSSTALDTITATQSLRDGETLVSSGGKFELGFFSPGSSTERRYVGIWYKRISARTVVWVANRERPLLDSSGVLKITNKSTLILVNGTGGVLWATNASRSAQNSIAQILDSGNLVVRDQNDVNSNFLWQSFDYPCDSQLPGMKVGRDRVTGFDRILTSWKSSDDPSPGSYTYRMDPRGYPQPFLLKDDVVLYRDGPWNGVWFSEAARFPMDASESFRFVLNDKEMYYIYESSIITNRALNPSGTLQRLKWSNQKQGWVTLFLKPIDTCDTFGICGAFASCNFANSPQCRCMKGFVPKSPKDWGAKDWTGGCIRSQPLNCSTHDGFIKYSNVKLPDTRYSWYNTTMNLYECKNKCLQNCSCVGYANLNVTNGGSGCLLWINSLLDVKVVAGPGQDLYVRVASSELGHGKKRVWVVVLSILLPVMLLGGGIVLILRMKRQKRREKGSACEGEFSINNTEDGESKLPIYPFNVIAQATNYFSRVNKLGEGGFGPVYKGVLNDGQEIAVKRLSKDSKQGLDEFKNEVMFIAKLQHRNLVKLIGYCIQVERLLIYEYMPNKSLDWYIFDTRTSDFLDWPKRLEIIKGIARGIVYLHQDSRLRIVHRDLKASNVLLDSDMNPRISDFGLARTFSGIEDEAKTKRVVGTYGYMPPEYTIDGLFSVKSDVFSFGVLVLEIVSGNRNRGFNHPDHHHNLLGHAWMLYRKGTALDVADPLIRNSSWASQIQRSIHIGLLCVQQRPEDRPSMSLVTVMLSSDSELPEPKEPGFYVARSLAQEPIWGKTELNSNNEMSMTLISGR